jgi:hypothetical protein
MLAAGLALITLQSRIDEVHVGGSTFNSRFGLKAGVFGQVLRDASFLFCLVSH